jgi:hypothetical protein
MLPPWRWLPNMRAWRGAILTHGTGYQPMERQMVSAFGGGLYSNGSEREYTPEPCGGHYVPAPQCLSYIVQLV